MSERREAEGLRSILLAETKYFRKFGYMKKRRSVFVERIGSRSREDQACTEKAKVMKKCCFTEDKYNGY